MVAYPDFGSESTKLRMRDGYVTISPETYGRIPELRERVNVDSGDMADCVMAHVLRD